MKHAFNRPFADPEAAARKLLEPRGERRGRAGGLIHIEKINAPFLFQPKARDLSSAPASNMPSHGWLELHESGTYVRLLSPDKDALTPIGTIGSTWT
jgi:hypothetical protein